MILLLTYLLVIIILLMTMNTDVNADAVHVYIHRRDPKRSGKPSSTREPDGIGEGTGDRRNWVLSLAHSTGRVHT